MQCELGVYYKQDLQTGYPRPMVAEAVKGSINDRDQAQVSRRRRP